MTLRFGLHAILVAASVACVADCSGKIVPAGGLVLVMCTDGSLRPDSLHLTVRGADGSKYLDDKEYDTRSTGKLPASLALDSNGHSDASVTIDVSAWNAGIELDARHYEFSQIPTDWVAEYDVIFSSDCSAATCTSGRTCGEGGQCTSDKIRAAFLRSYAGKASLPSKCSAQRLEVDGSAPDTSMVDRGADASADGAPALDGIDTPDTALGADHAVLSDAISDTLRVDADGATSDDGRIERDVESSRDAGPPCVFQAARCVGNVPQTCDANGSWQNAPDCVPGVTHCSGVRCVPIPPSCKDGPPGAGFDCSSGGTSDCCASYDVVGGSFYRDFDGKDFTDRGHPAKISSFRLDAYEITVGRFRQFVRAALAGWRPEAGDGKHTHLRDGKGLSNAAEAGMAFEPGWDASWNANLPATKAAWDYHLSCPAEDTATWTPNPGIANEKLPVTCIEWFDAYAFCIWDGGFLPSSAEWNYAAAGGNEQRIFAWGADAPQNDTSRAIWGCKFGGGNCIGLPNVAPVGSARGGDGKWGQSDLSGSLWEWNLDFEGPIVDPCDDCATTASGQGRVFRGGAFENVAADLEVAYHMWSRTSHADVGARCARVIP